MSSGGARRRAGRRVEEVVARGRRRRSGARAGPSAAGSRSAGRSSRCRTRSDVPVSSVEREHIPPVRGYRQTIRGERRGTGPTPVRFRRAFPRNVQSPAFGASCLDGRGGGAGTRRRRRALGLRGWCAPGDADGRGSAPRTAPAQARCRPCRGSGRPRGARGAGRAGPAPSDTAEPRGRRPSGPLRRRLPDSSPGDVSRERRPARSARGGAP